ncbi:MAG: hypothetical protein D6731_26065, partial [Planctomycetota bacterium]
MEFRRRRRRRRLRAEGAATAPGEDPPPEALASPCVASAFRAAPPLPRGPPRRLPRARRLFCERRRPRRSRR